MKAWIERSSNLHTSTPTIADRWRDQGLDVIELTDPSEITQATISTQIVWAWP